MAPPSAEKHTIIFSAIIPFNPTRVVIKVRWFVSVGTVSAGEYAVYPTISYTFAGVSHVPTATVDDKKIILHWDNDIPSSHFDMRTESWKLDNPTAGPMTIRIFVDGAVSGSPVRWPASWRVVATPWLEVY